MLAQPDPSTRHGLRDLTLLSLLYDSGARVQEITDLKLKDIRLTNPAMVTLTGKGRKARQVPLMKETCKLLDAYIRNFNLNSEPLTSPLFFNQKGQALSRYGITYILKKYVSQAELDSDTRKISPHVLRHTNDVVQHAAVVARGNITLVPDFDSLPAGIKEKLKQGLYSIGDSKQVDGNLRAVIVDENGVRVKDITLKKVINNPGTLETTRSIANQMQMKQIQDTLKGIQEMQSYQLDRDRDRDILTPFFDARDYILQAQNAASIESRNQFLEKASDRMTTALNSVYAEMRTASLHLAKNTKWSLFHKQSSIDTLLSNLSDDLQLATKFSGVQMQVFEALGRREDSKLVLDRYQTVMHDFITQEIGGRGMSAIELMHDNYHYSKENTDCWYTFSKELEPALESTRLAIENKDVYIVSVEDVNDEQE